MDRDELTRRLMSTFLVELDEQVAGLERDFLTLERGPRNGARVELLAGIYRSVHGLKGAARSVNVDVVERVCHHLESVIAALAEGTCETGAGLLGLLLAVADGLADASRRLRAGRPLHNGPLPALALRLESALAPTHTPPGAPAAPARPPALPEVAEPLSAAEPAAFVRVPVERLDRLMARNGELLVARRRAMARARDCGGLHEYIRRWETSLRRARAPRPDDTARIRDKLRHVGRELERLGSALVGDLRALDQAAAPLDHEVRQTRLQPFGDVCQPLLRTVQNLTRAGQKQVDLEVMGAEVELDRSVLERLRGPLLHLVRNALDHGIEPPAQRLQLGKPPRGRVTVSAHPSRGLVEIEVADDGRGLDLEAIARHLKRWGRPVPEDADELAQSIFIRGFSTAQALTELSGRGVGLDAVRSQVEAANGSITVQFTPGRGSRFRLTIPLTLTSIRVLLVRAAGQTFALPAASVTALLRLDAASLTAVGGRDRISWGGSLVAVATLAETLGLTREPPDRPHRKAPLVLVSSAGQTAGFLLDEAFAEQDAVVHDLGSRFSRVPNISGATLLPDGQVVLILNSAELVRKALSAPGGHSVLQALAEPAPRRRRLLIADDSMTVRGLLRSILEHAGFEVIEAANGEQAWEQLQQTGADLVVADVQMPHQDGLALTESIRSSPRFRELPVVLVTALESDRDRAAGVRAGANAYLVKRGFDQRTLLETIEQLL